MFSDNTTNIYGTTMYGTNHVNSAYFAHHSASSHPCNKAHDDDDTSFTKDLSSLFTSSSPGDLLDDADIDDFFDTDDRWTASSNEVRELVELIGRLID